MSKLKFVLPLMLVLATCWADIPSDPIFNDIDPQSIQDVQEEYRLPTDIVPTNYDIQLQTFIDVPDAEKNFTFKGTSKILLEVTKETKSITFHAKELKIDIKNSKVEYNTKNGTRQIKIKNMQPDLKKDFITLVFESNIPKMSNVVLILSYTGKINNKLRGFYKSHYLDKDNKTRWLATTQFEPVHAREAFPCWDEPAIKASFKLVLKQDPKYLALSNTRNITNDVDKNVRTIVFDATPKMSTYLVAFVISDYLKYSEKDETFNVWTKPDAIKSTQHAYEYGKLILKELSDWTRIDYYEKTGKMDQISIPHFAAGAMENWGLVTYREPALLYTEGKSTTKNKQDITTVIAHEFAHQWFGNLVTPKWWDYIWLSEGFATFFQYYIVDQVQKSYNHTSWRLMEQFVVNNVQTSSFTIDATTKTRSMNVKPSVKTPSQISSLFDTISYKKAASVIRMMQHFLNETNFQNGIQEYLNNYQETTKSSVTDNELFNSLDYAIEGKNILPKELSVVKIMKNWVNEPGYPVVIVTRLPEKFNVIQIKQERFFLEKPLQKDITQWYIPIDYIKQNSDAVSKIEWLLPNTPKTLTTLERKEWILINKDQAGYYRVNYDNMNWYLLAEYLKTNNFQKISAVNRAQLIDDALNLARAGYLKYIYALGITVYLKQETDYIPWHAAVRAFNYLDNKLQGTENYTQYRNYVAHKLQSFADKFVKDVEPNDSHVDKLAKVMALNAACKYGVEKCEKFVEQKFKEWLEEKKDDKQENKLWIDYRPGVLCAGLRNADDKTWNKTLEKYMSITDKTEKKEVFAGLGCVTNEKILHRFLELTLKKDSVINVFDAITSIRTGNLASIDLLIEFISNNIEQIRGNNNENITLLLQHLELLAGRVTTPKQYTELSLIVHMNLQDQNFEGLNHAIENLVWLKRYHSAISYFIYINPPDSNEDKPKENGNSKKKNSASSFCLSSFLIFIPVMLARF